MRLERSLLCSLSLLVALGLDVLVVLLLLRRVHLLELLHLRLGDLFAGRVVSRDALREENKVDWHHFHDQSCNCQVVQ